MASDQEMWLKDCIEKRKNEIAPNKNSNSDFVKKQFICRPGIWRAASDNEISKYYWPDNLDSIKGKEGDTYIGKNDTTICYVYRNNSWEKSDPIHCIVGLCTEKNQDVIQKGTDGEWYKCNNLKWEKSDECTYTISKWKDGKEWEIRHEKKCNDQCYVYDNGHIQVNKDGAKFANGIPEADEVQTEPSSKQSAPQEVDVDLTI